MVDGIRRQRADHSHLVAGVAQLVGGEHHVGGVPQQRVELRAVRAEQDPVQQHPGPPGVAGRVHGVQRVVAAPRRLVQRCQSVYVQPAEQLGQQVDGVPGRVALATGRPAQRGHPIGVGHHVRVRERLV
jgi:hypothetical protein